MNMDDWPIKFDWNLCRYAVFAGDNKRQKVGGMHDYATRFDLLGEAIAWATGYLAGSGTFAWVMIWDMHYNTQAYYNDNDGG